MKRQFLLLVFVCCSLWTQAQFVYIPDPNFRAFLQSEVPNCMFGDSLQTYCSDVFDTHYMDVNGLGISDLTGLEYFTGLDWFWCRNNNLDSLTQLPPSVARIWCDSNQLVYIELPPLLDEIFCSHNQLTSLPDLSLQPSLWTLDCSYNQLSTLPLLNDNFHNDLICDHNQISVLPELPSNIEELRCGFNQLEALPPLPNSLTELDASNNQLSCLPILPDNLYILEIDGNNIACLPNVPTGLDTTNINLPVCTSNNIHDCTFLRPVYGNVYHDLNDNCQLEQTETGLQNRLIQASNGATAISGQLGNYQLFLDTGDYSITQMPLPVLQPSTVWDIDCPNIPYQIEIDETVDSVPGIDFPNTSVTDCHWLSVNVVSSMQRPCFTTNSYHVSYCNYGSEFAGNVYVELEFPSSVIPIGSSIPWQNIGNGIYQFDIGNLDIDECGSFSIMDSVSCDAEVGATSCVRAEIFPHSPCLVGDPSWDNSRLEVIAGCEGAQIEFTIENTGVGNMNASSNYRVYENNALLVSNQPVQLNSGASIVFPVNATGSTYRVEVDQSLGHPGFSFPRVHIEGCGAPPFSYGQILPASQDDADAHIEISCVQLSASYDPNDKTVVPAGYGTNHLLHPNDSLLEYRIRFQNTGNDTAFNIEVVDTLPITLLNPTTFISGASSHPYTVRMHGNGIVTWRFENILLPDSTTNEAESHGFVKFQIRTQPNLQNGMVINNNAGIYFDFNSAIITNTSFLTISDIPVVASVENVVTEIGLSVYPNPFYNETTILIDKPLLNGMVKVYDAVGREVLQEQFSGKSHALKRRGLTSGPYVLSIYDGNTHIKNARVSIINR